MRPRRRLKIDDLWQHAAFLLIIAATLALFLASASLEGLVALFR